jgi:hypothetical protein
MEWSPVQRCSPSQLIGPLAIWKTKLEYIGGGSKIAREMNSPSDYEPQAGITGEEVWDLLG